MAYMSVVIPCYNESLSIPIVFQKALYITSNYDIEFIFLDNGSNDDTWNIMQDLNSKKQIKCLRIEENKGYGFGIKFALKYAKGNYIGWTHADLQTDLFDIIKAYQKIKQAELRKNNQNLYAIKGIRFGRKLSDVFISYAMSSLMRILFFPWKTYEINAQPSLYHFSILSYLDKSPDDYSFDIYAYLLSFYLKFQQLRFPVLFPSRIYGKSHWNIDVLSKLVFIRKTFSFILKMFFKFKKF